MVPGRVAVAGRELGAVAEELLALEDAPPVVHRETPTAVDDAECVLVDGPEGARAVDVPGATPVVALCDADSVNEALSAGATRTIQPAESPATTARVANAVCTDAMATETPGLGETGARLRDALAVLQDVFFVFALDGRMITWNDRLVEVTGFDEERVAGMEPLDFIAPDERGRAAAAITEVVETGTGHAELGLRTADGDPIPCEFRAALLHDDEGEPAAICGIGRDITERQRRERMLEEQASKLRTVNHVNSVIRDVTNAIVEAQGREDIEETVCEQLVDAEPYAFVWIGDYDPANQDVRPRASAGEGETYLDKRPGDQHAEGVTAADAIATGEVQVVQAIDEEAEADPWREAALAEGFRSGATIPLSHRGASYGALCVYARRKNAFDEMERAVLAELGHTIGFAISAAENRRALVSDAAVVVDLTFDGGPQFVDLSGRLDCAVDLEGTTRSERGDAATFLGLGETDPGTVRDAIAEDAELTVITAEDERLLVRTVPPTPSLVSVAADHSAVVTAAHAEGGEGEATLVLPSHVAVRDVVESVQSVFPATTLRARRSRERPADPGARFREAVEESLTTRQREAVETAHNAGFFEWPRAADAEAVAELLGVAPPTFHEHVRRAERKLVDAYLRATTLTN